MLPFLRSLASGTRAAALPMAAVLTAAIAAAQSQTFVHTGTLQTFTVPAGCTSLLVQADGAKGGNGNGAGAGTGGLGARVTGVVPCTPGATLQILVGRGGATTLNGRGGGGGGYTGGGGGPAAGPALGGSSYSSPLFSHAINTPGANANSVGSLTIRVHYSMATVVSAGAGCPSSGGSNTLEANSLPWVDSTFSIRASGMPALALVAVVTGFTPTALPLSVVFPQGQSGCNLLVTPDLVDVLFSTGTATAQLVLPNTLTLVGMSFLQQMVPLQVDPALNVLAVTATNALQMTVGY